MGVSGVLFLVLSIAVSPSCLCVSRRGILGLRGKARETSCHRKSAKRCCFCRIDCLLSLFFFQTKASLCRQDLSVFCVSSAFKGVICLWCMQDAPSRRLCWWCAEASCIDRRHNGAIVGEWGNSHRVTQVCDLEADWMTKLHRWIPAYRMSLFKGKLVWGWLIVLKKWLKANCLSLGERQSILMSFKFLSPRPWVDCWGWFSRVPLSMLLSYLLSLDANSLLNCHDSVISSVWSSEQNT